ncbi:hypothetical protein RAB80_018303 [Fusarium oxysporum f. sp. vasinfectum]|uniref:Uncharacterized protein n=1 Tax=Fusarium oxysporum f. sp. vasinfectum 25433 TaxID=1089449 RepID=X0M888_FUSOX|nr:hypothetical protein FOTG_14895 [Fusarium oxysporum f. sp. vasinfectum 25433]KAK2666203.1 hypothetical protein RAB80_018303 [Fusarium oxysporum f. sp. vasinfectum]KAK2922378.1 hypothetical protein FoTM2_017734 [Fusarium oxysporum f. sp. vasinfectum]
MTIIAELPAACQAKQSLPQALQNKQVTPLPFSSSQEVLQTICLHERFAEGLTPEQHFKKVQELGEDGHTLQLLKTMEGANKLLKEPSQRLDHRIQLMESHLNLKPFPEYERPSDYEAYPSAFSCLVVLQRSGKCKSDFCAWPVDTFNNHAMIFAAQAFGRLGYKFPVQTHFDAVSDFLNDLIRLHNLSRHESTQDTARSLESTTDFDSYDGWVLVECPTVKSGTVASDWSLVDNFEPGSCRVTHVPGDRKKDRLLKTHDKELYGLPAPLRDYKELARAYPPLEAPEGWSFWSFCRQLQEYFQITANIADCPQEGTGDTAIRYIIQWLKDLECRASEKDILMNDPLRVLSSIWIMHCQKRATRYRSDQPEALRYPEYMEGNGEIPHCHQPDFRCFEQESGGQIPHDPTLCKHGHARAATPLKSISIGLASWREKRSCPDWGVVQHIAVLRACYLLFRADQSKDAQNGRMPAEQCIECIWESCMEKHDAGKLDEAVSEIESLLGQEHIPDTLDDRMTACEKRLSLPPCPARKGLFTEFKQMFSILQMVPSFQLQNQDKEDVVNDIQAQYFYAAFCLLMLNYSPAKMLEDYSLNNPKTRLIVFNQILAIQDHRDTYATANEARITNY